MCKPMLTVAVLICTYNGSKYLRKQLDSVVNQSHKSWEIFVSDDGSTDDTLAILKEYQDKIGEDKFHVQAGPGRGFAWNFLNLLNSAGDGFFAYAFCDQDDIWKPIKLEQGVKWLSQQVLNQPAMHCGRTELIDETDKAIGYSPLFTKKPSLRNALIQSIAGGNTMMLNHQARELVIKTPQKAEIVSHDWWVYIVLSCFNAAICYDEKPTIDYRQHTNNIVGSNTGWFARIKRISGLMDGKFRNWIEKNINALHKMDITLPEENKRLLNEFIEARNAPFFRRIILFRQLSLYRQTVCGTIAFYIAVMLKKI